MAGSEDRERDKFDFTSKIKCQPFSTNHSRAIEHPYAKKESQPMLHVLYKN